MFGRTSRSTPEVVAPAAGAPKGGGKGRPTPKRREAERGRRRAVAAPRDRKEAYRRARQEQREQRTRTMHGLRAGDERLLPPRDRGPVRKYARDLVDSRRSMGEFFLPIALIIVVLSYTGSPKVKELAGALWLFLTLVLIADSIVLALRLKRGLRRIHPGEKSRGAVPYALMRSMQIRRFRLPAPRLKPGGKPVTR